MQGIYEIVNLQTFDSYVGRSVSIGQRWGDHVLSLRNGRHINGNLQAAWDKYGEGGFSFCVLERIKNEADLQEREQYYLNRAFEVGGTYNIAGNAYAQPRNRKLRLTKQEIARYLKLAQETVEECGGYYAAAKKLGDTNLRAGLWLLIKKSCSPSKRLQRALLGWENRPIIIEIAPGSVIIDEMDLLDSDQPVDILIMCPGEIRPYLRNCAKCSQQMVKWSPERQYCTRCREKV